MPVASNSRFLELRERVQRLRNDESIADPRANDDLKRIAAQAACAYGECAYSGKPGFDKQLFNPRPDVLLSRRTDVWALQWCAIIDTLSVLYPADIPCDPGAPRMVRHSEYAGSGVFYQSDWRLRADDYAAALGMLAELAGESKRDGDTPPDRTATAGELSGEARALAVLTDHPDWTDARIAESAGVNRTTLYTYDRFTQARALLKASKPTPPDRHRGRKKTRLPDTLPDT
jgi:hypothetical protein